MFECKFKGTASSWYRNGKRRRISDSAECLWHALKDCSDHWGAIEGDIDDLVHTLFAGRAGWDAVKMFDCLAELVDAGLIALYQSEDGEPWIEVLRHDDFQSPGMIRRRPARTSPIRVGNGANSRSLTPGSVVVRKSTPDSDSDRDRDRDKEKENLRSNRPTTSETDAGPQPNHRQPPPDEPTTDQTAIAIVWDHYLNSFVPAADRSRYKLTSERRKKIATRLKDYTADELREAITGYAQDRWRQADWKRRAKITSLLRNGETVDTGRSLNRTPAMAGGDSYVRPQIEA